jgi:hypothetical protein
MNTHDIAIPQADTLFEPVYDDYGLRLALVFGNHAEDGVCPYARAQRCYHCDIGFGEGVQFDTASNLRRLAWFRQHYAAYWHELAHLVIYNSGSTLNPRELAPEVCQHIMAFARSLPRLRQVSMDSREGFVTTDAVRQLATALGAGKRLSLILGVESADDRIRNQFLNKKMPKSMIEKALQRFRLAWDGLTASQRETVATPGLSINIVIGSPGTDADTVQQDALNTAHYALDLAQRYDLALDLNIHPFYPSRHSLTHFPTTQRVSPDIVLEVVAALKTLQSDKVHFFIGLQDENHDQEPQQRHKEM